MDTTKLSNKELIEYARQSVSAWDLRGFADQDYINDMPSPKYDDNEMVYLGSVYKIADRGHIKMSRPGYRTLSLPATRQVYDLTDGKMPMPRSKQLFHRSWTEENKWFLNGDNNIRHLRNHGIGIWDGWVIPSTAVFEPTDNQTGADIEAYIRCKMPKHFPLLKRWKDSRGIATPTLAQMAEFVYQVEGGMEDIPKVRLAAGVIGEGAYGPMWRKWRDTRVVRDTSSAEHEAMAKRGFGNEEKGYFTLNDVHYEVYERVIDQFGDAIKMLRTGADSRRIIVSGWNPALVDETVLPPCHSMFQFISYDNFDGGPRSLHCMLHQRSSDRLLGGAFNANQYAMLTHLVAHITNHKGVSLTVNNGDDHIYENQIPMLSQQFDRVPIELPPATIVFPEHVKELSDFINLSPAETRNLIQGYAPGSYHPRVDYPVAI